MVSDLPIEFEERTIYETINSRNATQFYYGGLGIADLCVLYKRKEAQRGLFWSNGDTELAGYFHWVYGYNVSGVMSMCSYITQLLAAQEKAEIEKRSSWLFGKPSTVDVQNCEKAIFCCYNFLSRCDIRVELTLPGSVKSYMIDESGTISEEISEELWRETYLCAVLRYEQMINTEEFRANLPINVRIFDLRISEDLDQVLMQQAVQSTSRGINSGLLRHSLKRLSSPSEKNNTQMSFCGSANNEFIYAMRDHFFRNRQYQEAIDFFNTISVQTDSLSVHIAEAFRQMNKVEDSEQILTDLLHADNKNIDLLIAECQAIINNNKLKDHVIFSQQTQPATVECEYGLSLARMAIQIAPTKVLPWLTLAHLCALSGDISSSLACLNVFPLSTTQFRTRNKSTYCFYSGDKDVAVASGSDQANPLAVPYWFSSDHYKTEFVYNQPAKETYRESLVNLKANSHLVQFLQYSLPNSCFFQILLDEELTLDYLLSYSYNARHKLIRSYAYSVLLELNHRIGYKDLLKTFHELFDNTSVESIVQLQAHDQSNQSIKVQMEASEDSNQPIKVTLGLEAPPPMICQPWLTELFEMLRADLDELHVWMNESVPLSSSDWFYRGMLAERLQLLGFALIAYKNSIVKGFHIKSYQRLLYLYTSSFTETSDHNLDDSLVLMDQLLSFYLLDVNIHKVTEEFRWSRLHPCIQESMYSLVSKYGLKRIRLVMNKPLAKCRSFPEKNLYMIHELLLQSVVNKTHGYNL